MCLICDRIKIIKDGTNPYFVKELETGYVVIGDNQHFCGYTLFLYKRHGDKTELFHLEPTERAKFLEEMTIVAEAVSRAFGAEKINYELLGMGDAHLHWHLFPRVSGDIGNYGNNGRGPTFQKMLKDIASGTFHYVIAWKSSRIGRNMLEAMVNECRLADNGVRILYVGEDFDDTAAGRFAKRSMMNVNQFYIENMAEDVKRGMNSNAEQCLVNGPAPFGYKTEDHHYVIDEPAAAIVREIFERTATGEPFVGIYTDLNQRNIRTRKGGKWVRSSFQAILRNEKYRGVYIFDETRI